MQITPAGFDALLSEVYESERNCLARIAAKVGVSRDESSDVVHEAFLQAVEQAAEFTGVEAETHLRAWLRMVVYHRAVDAARHCGCHPRESLDAEGDERIDEAAWERAELAERCEWLSALLERGRAVNEENQRLACEHYLQNRPIKELAEEADSTEDAIDGRIRRQLKKLRALADGDAGLGAAGIESKSGVRKKTKKS